MFSLHKSVLVCLLLGSLASGKRPRATTIAWEVQKQSKYISDSNNSNSNCIEMNVINNALGLMLSHPTIYKMRRPKKVEVDKITDTCAVMKGYDFEKLNKLTYDELTFFWLCLQLDKDILGLGIESAERVSWEMMKRYKPWTEALYNLTSVVHCELNIFWNANVKLIEKFGEIVPGETSSLKLHQVDWICLLEKLGNAAHWSKGCWQLIEKLEPPSGFERPNKTKTGVGSLLMGGAAASALGLFALFKYRSYLSKLFWSQNKITPFENATVQWEASCDEVVTVAKSHRDIFRTLIILAIVITLLAIIIVCLIHWYTIPSKPKREDTTDKEETTGEDKSRTK